MQVFDFQLNGPSIYYEVNIKAFGKKKKKHQRFRIQDWHKSTAFGVNKQITEVGFYKYVLKNTGENIGEITYTQIQTLVGELRELVMDREAWRAAIHSGHKESDMTERLN